MLDFFPKRSPHFFVEFNMFPNFVGAIWKRRGDASGHTECDLHGRTSRPGSRSTMPVTMLGFGLAATPGIWPSWALSTATKVPPAPRQPAARAFVLRGGAGGPATPG